MSETKPKIQRDYPPTIKLDNNTEVSLRLMIPADTYRIVAFARSLSIAPAVPATCRS